MIKIFVGLMIGLFGILNLSLAGDISFGEAKTAVNGADAQEFEMKDIDGDGKLDWAWRDSSGDLKYSLQGSSSTYQTYVLYSFEELNQNQVIDKSTDGTRSGTIEGTSNYSDGPTGRGNAAYFDGNWRIVVNNSSSDDFSLEGNWTMGFSIYLSESSHLGNGIIQRLSSNSGYCGYRGIIILSSNSNRRIKTAYVGTEHEGTYNDDIIPLNSLIDGQWNRVVIIHRSDETGDVYVNGIKTSDNVSFKIDETNQKHMSIGGNYKNLHCYGDDYANDVKLDDFAILKEIVLENDISNDSISNPIGF